MSSAPALPLGSPATRPHKQHLCGTAESRGDRGTSGGPRILRRTAEPLWDCGTSGGPWNFRGTVDPPGDRGSSGGPRNLREMAESPRDGGSSGGLRIVCGTAESLGDCGTSGRPWILRRTTEPLGDHGSFGGLQNLCGTAEPLGDRRSYAGLQNVLLHLLSFPALWNPTNPASPSFKNPNDPYHTPQRLHTAFNCSKWIIRLCLVFPATLEKSFLRGELCFLLLLLVNQPSPTGRGPMLEHEKLSPSQSIHNPPPGSHLSLLPSNHLTILFCLGAYYSWPQIPPATICQTTTPPSRVTSSLQSPAQSPRQ